MRYRFQDYTAWRKWVVPESLHDKPIHRWLVFPHSFTDDIVRALADEWGIGSKDKILDPFSGAGTTLLAAKQLEIPAVGYDLSPLATLAGRVKVSNFNVGALNDQWSTLKRHVRVREPNGEVDEYPGLVAKALPKRKLATFHAIKREIQDLDAARIQKDFFTLALISLIPVFSNAISTGGWLSWTANHSRASDIPAEFDKVVQSMIADLYSASSKRRGSWHARMADARQLPVDCKEYSAVITSPPYPNRHDYTRVFGVELMFGFLDWEQTRRLRYQTMHSHPEARPKRPCHDQYVEPKFVSRAIKSVAENEDRQRIVDMLRGYFIDLYLSLKEIERVLKRNGRAALVLGNAQYDGIPIEVDKAAAHIGEQVGLVCQEIRIARLRGNSAQQMKSFGRNPARESVIIFQKP